MKEHNKSKKATYVYELVDGVLCLADEDLAGISLTNEMERVLKEIKEELGELPEVIIYRESEGLWDSVEGEGAVLHSLETSFRHQAIQKAVKRHKKAKKKERHG